MPRLHCLLFLLVSPLVSAQIKHSSVPLGGAIGRALSQSALTSASAAPFHLRLVVSEPENPKSPYQGTIEEWWSSDRNWRREINGPEGVRQLVVTHDGSKSEEDTGDYLPLWLRNFSTAVLDPIPDAAAWTTNTGASIDQITMPDGRKSSPCTRAKGQIGSGTQTVDAFYSLCFDPSGRFSSYVSPRYSMSFEDYRDFAGKQVPRRLSADPEPGTKLVGLITTLEPLDTAPTSSSLFTPLSRNDDRFHTIPVSPAVMQQLIAGNPPVTWPPVHSGNTHGRLGMYISVDATGNVREAWPLNSDNAGLEDPARDQVRKWKLKVANFDGHPVQIDGGLGFAFETAIADPLPHLSDTETRALATHIVEPVFPAGQFQAGQVFEVEISVNEQGKFTGVTFSGIPNEAVGPINLALSQWIFRPYLRDGKPQYIHGTVRFTAPR